MTHEAHVRPAHKSDLPFINAVIKAAVMSWPVADRAKRLSASVLCYDKCDMEHYAVFVCEEDGHIIGIAASDPFDDDALFHGLYVHPAWQRSGVGRALMAVVFDDAAARGKPGMLIKAARASVPYFEGLDLERLPTQAASDYPYRFWHTLHPSLPHQSRL